MKKIDDCREVYSSTAPNNLIGKHTYERIGFVKTNIVVGDQELHYYKC